MNTLAPVIELKNVVKVFKDFWGRPKARAVAGIDLNIHPGEVFGLLGPNGSGKSTTLKMILGLLHPTAGSIRIFGQPPNDVGVKSRLGYMPEESYLYPYLTAEETLELYGRLLDLPASERRARAAQLLMMAGLAHTGRRAVGEFSKGMARRISLAQALLNDPDLILLDEPTAGLDPIGCRQFKDLILKLAARGKTIVLCSHLLADVEDVCDRIAIMYDGLIYAHGDIRTMLEQRDVCRFTIHQPPMDAVPELTAILEAKLGRKPEVDHPSRTLEELFLATIAQAQARGTNEHSGAQPAMDLAPFLNDGAPADGRAVTPDHARTT